MSLFYDKHGEYLGEVEIPGEHPVVLMPFFPPMTNLLPGDNEEIAVFSFYRRPWPEQHVYETRDDLPAGFTVRGRTENGAGLVVQDTPEETQ